MIDKIKKGNRIANRENTLVFLHFLNEAFNKVEKTLSKLHIYFTMDQLDISINPAEKYSYSSVRWKEPEMYVTSLLLRKKIYKNNC